tara:strand:+ start:92 stop:505 length:414 start_codon:yes stop_codon:yes gene_type:complete
MGTTQSLPEWQIRDRIRVAGLFGLSLVDRLLIRNGPVVSFDTVVHNILGGVVDTRISYESAKQSADKLIMQYCVRDVELVCRYNPPFFPFGPKETYVAQVTCVEVDRAALFEPHLPYRTSFRVTWTRVHPTATHEPS